MSTLTKILGIDPGKEKTGYSHPDGYHGIWRLKATGSEHGGRPLVRLREHLLKAHRAWGYTVLAAEDASFGSPNRNVQASHNELRGVIKLVAAELDVPVFFYRPKEIKAFAGGGGTSKAGMMQACRVLLGFEPLTDDVADAAFVRALATQDLEREAKARATTPSIDRSRELFA